MRLPHDLRKRLTDIGRSPDDEIDLGGAALVLAAIDRPGVSIDRYLRHLEQLAQDVRDYVGGGEGDAPPALGLRIEALVQVIVKRFGYGGTEEIFDDLDGANLMRVIDGRTGLPVALGILFINTAGLVGWPMSGLDFPGRFLVRLEADGERRVLDPFAGLRILEPQDMRDMFKAVAGNHVELKPEHYRVMANRDILLRLQNNIKVRLLRANRFDDVVEVLEAMVLFAPMQADLWRELGMLLARQERLADAIEALEEHLNLSQGAEAGYKTSQLLQELRQRLN